MMGNITIQGSGFKLLIDSCTVRDQEFSDGGFYDSGVKIVNYFCFEFVVCREICEILASENEKPIKVLLVLEFTNPRSDLSAWAERIVYVSEPVMRKLAGVDSTEGLQGVGVLALPSSFCNLADTQAANWLSSPRRVLVLDGIQVN